MLLGIGLLLFGLVQGFPTESLFIMGILMVLLVYTITMINEKR